MRSGIISIIKDDTELWEAIDATGQEVIPCIFDEIDTYYDEPNVFKAHYGGWKEGKYRSRENDYDFT